MENNDLDMRGKYNALFDTPLGRDVLADLRLQFHDADLADIDSPHRTIVRAAQHDVVHYILDMTLKGDR